MKRWWKLLVLFLILPFYGCNVKTEPAKECVFDTIDAPKLPAMRIESHVPTGAILTLSKNDGRCAVFSHEDFTITQDIFAAENRNAAFVHISGRNQSELNTILAGTFPQEEYRFTWTVAGETGTELCQGCLFFDGSFYYAVCIQSSAKNAKEYEKEFSDFFANVELIWV